MIPLVVAVTGHRDLVSSEIPVIRERIASLFCELRDRFPHHELTLLSPLAEGADSVAAEVALEQRVRLLVPLPSAEEEYLAHFSEDSARSTFRDLRARAEGVFVLGESGLRPAPPAGVAADAWEEAYPFARLGVFLAAHCHMLIAVWDGKASSEIGGTAAVVDYHLDNSLEGITSPRVSTQQMMVDDESDLVYHIVCSRDRPAGEPKIGLEPGDAFWRTNDLEHPVSRSMPEQHERIFERSNEFGVDAARLADRIEESEYSLLDGVDLTSFPPGVETIDEYFVVADQLAIHYQRRTLAALKATHALAFLTGLAFILYSDLETLQAFLFAFLMFIAASAGVHFLATRGKWHQKYMDYRTLAEGLRVQLYWTVAGVTEGQGWLFPHDPYLRSHDPELGWIRNAMRAAGLRSNAEPRPSETGMALALQDWVGGESTGQLGYFGRVSRARSRRHAQTERLGMLSLAVSISTVLVLVAVGNRFSESTIGVLTVVMGASLLLFGVREAYSYATAVKELMTQHAHMLRIFRNAHRRLSAATDPADRRSILLALGYSALDDHSDWLRMHRDRLFSGWRLRA